MSGVLDAAAWLVSVLAASTVAALLTGRWLRSRLAGQSQPAPAPVEDMTPEETQRLSRLVFDAPRIPQQGTRRFHPVGPPLDIDALIASLEPCGSGVVPTCRLHDPETCRTAGPCCPSCPSA